MSLIQTLLGEPTIKFCEAAGQGLIARPGYAFSNLIYFIVGIYLLMKKDSKISKSFGALTLLVGVLSMVYDITYLYATQLADLFGMFLFASFILTLNIRRINPKIKNSYGISFLVAFVSTALNFLLKGYSGDIIFAVLILSVLSTQIYASKEAKHIVHKPLFITVGLVCIGGFIWIFDASRILCSPWTIFNGRAIFHYLTAISIIYLEKFYEQFKKL